MGVDAFGSILKKFHETSDFDTKEIYPYRIEGLGKNLIPSATNFDVIDVFEKVTDEAAAHKARELCVGRRSFYRIHQWCCSYKPLLNMLRKGILIQTVLL